MSDPGLTPEALRQLHADAVLRANTFQTAGVSEQAARDYLDTREGRIYREALIRADPGASIIDIDQRAMDQLRSGRELPRMEIVDEPLVKIVPRGATVPSYSPFFARESVFEDAVSRGHNLSQHFALPIRSEAQVYDVYRIRPDGPTAIFTNTVAPTSELAGRVVKPGGAEQVLVPNRGLYSDAIRIGSIGNDLALHRDLVVGRGLGGPIAAIGDAIPERAAAPRIGTAGRALGIAGLALDAYDGAQTVREVRRLRGEGNDTSAESELIHFGSRSVGGLGGAAIGAGVGGASTSWSGPGMLVGGGVGGIVGVFGGQKFAEWTDNRSIYNQEDRSGHTWAFDPDNPGGGWQRPAPIDASLDGIDNARRGTLRAPPSLANELDYKATTTSVELILGGPPPQRDPFSQPANEHDARGSRPANWQHDSDSGQWLRRVYGPFVERGMTPYHTETASPERATQLDRAAAQVVLENTHNSPASIAARYEDAYITRDWAAHGPMPAAVTSARTDLNTLIASDENRYQRQADGRWVSDGLVYDSTARGPLKAELDATRTVLQAHLPPPREIPPPVPMTEDARVRDTVTGAYANAGIDANPERIAAAAAAVQATWEANGLDPATTALAVQRDATGRFGLDSPIGSLQLEADGRTYRMVALTGIEEIRAIETARQTAPQDDAMLPRNAARREADASPSIAEPTVRSAALLADHPAHPDHDTFTRIHDWVRGTGQWNDDASRNVASALYLEQTAAPLVRRVDQVTGSLGKNGEENVYAVYAPFGDKTPFFYACVDGREAALQPSQRSLEQAEQIVQQAAQQQQAKDLQQQDQQALRAPQMAI